MKPFFFVIILTALLFSCKSWKPSMVQVEHNPLSPKLHHLELRYEDVEYSDEYCYKGVTYYHKEISGNLVDTTGDKYGYIVFQVTHIESNGGGIYPLFTWLTLTIANLCGMPWAVFKRSIEVEFRIYDSDRTLLGTYTAVGESKNISAYYYGYYIFKADAKCTPDAVLDAFRKIRPNIQADVERLNQELESAGNL